MATTRLAAGATTATADFTGTAGMGIFLVPAAGQILDPNASAALFFLNGTDPAYLGEIRNGKPQVLEAGGNYRVLRLAGANLGVVSEP